MIGRRRLSRRDGARADIRRSAADDGIPPDALQGQLHSKVGGKGVGARTKEEGINVDDLFGQAIAEHNSELPMPA